MESKVNDSSQSSNQPASLVFKNVRIATFDGTGQDCGELLDHTLGVIDDRIAWILPDDQAIRYSGSANVVDAGGHWLTPGLIDCHTHLVYGGNRATEWQRRLNGDSYEAIAGSGGGIVSSVRATRKADLQQLVDSASKRLSRLMQEGVTTVEIKSGYGLDLENELKMLQAARQLAQTHRVNVVTTLLAAHTIPAEFQGRSDAYIDLVCDTIIPAAVHCCDCVDVFCESIAFDVPQCVRVFEAAQRHRLDIKVHAEQLSHTGIAVQAAAMGALSVDHLEYLTAEDCQQMADLPTVATLLPGAYYCLNETQQPPIEALRKNGIAMAVATDCNPGSSPLTSLLLAANMSCNLFGLTAEEALIGITRNAAKALGRSDRFGTLRPGMQADLVIWDVDSLPEIVYGIGHNPCHSVYHKGQQVI